MMIVLLDCMLNICLLLLFCHYLVKSGHCLHELLSCYAERPDRLRRRGHDYVLPVCSKKLHKQSFLVRSLFDCV